MTDIYPGIRVHNVKKELIDKLYTEKEIEVWDNRYNWYENLYVVVKDETGSQSSALAKVVGNKLKLLAVDRSLSISGITPRNKEQCFAMDALLTDGIQVVVLTGKAGTGKTILTLAAALHAMDQRKYDRIILTRPMSWVGKHALGALPGDIEDKFGPYLENYMCNLQYMMGGNKERVKDLIAQYHMEFLPLQLIRGASWPNSFIIADEVQTLDYHEMTTLGTRVGEGSKIVIMGDMAQRDEKIAKDKTGIFKFVNHMKAKESPFVASIELIKSERGRVSELFAEVFEAK